MQALSNSIRSGEGKARWRASLRAAKAAMKPEVRARVESLLRKGYREKMTPERQAELGQRKRLAWTQEARQAAAARERQRQEDDPARGQRLMATARAAKAEKQEEVNKKKLETCARQLVEKIKGLLSSTEEVVLDKKTRRALRERGERYLLLASTGMIKLSDDETKILREGVDASRKCGATLQSRGRQVASERRARGPRGVLDGATQNV